MISSRENRFAQRHSEKGAKSTRRLGSLRNVTNLQVIQRQLSKPVDHERLQEIQKVREELFNEMYPLPHVCKEIAWVILLILSVAACLAAIVYGLSV